jgi:hypothetical protein
MPGSRTLLQLAIAWCCLIVPFGCGPSARIADGTDPWASSVGQCARLVERYRVANRGQMPGSEQDLRSFAGGMDAADLKLLGIGAIEGCFVSSRDGRPLAIVLGRLAGRGGDPSVVCHEQEGRDGVRLVGKLGGDVEVADESRFAELAAKQ